MIVECSRVIKAPAGFVFEVLHDYQLRLHWDPFLREAVILDDSEALAVGSRTRCSVKWRLFGWSMVTEYVSFKSGEVAAVRMLQGPFFFESFAASFRHRQHPDGSSEILYRLNFQLQPWLPKILEELVAKILRWETSQRLKALGRFCSGRQDVHLKTTRLNQFLEVQCPSPAEAKFIYDEVFEQDCYLGPLPSLGENPIIVDVGSNIGLFALRALQLYPDAKLLCLEPGPENFQALEHNLAGKGVTLQKLALGTEPSTLCFYYYPLAPGNSSLYRREINPEMLEKLFLAFKATYRTWWKPLVNRTILNFAASRIWGKPQMTATPVIRLSTVLTRFSEAQIDLIKIDVERAELDVLRGIDDSDWQRIRHLVVEVTTFDWGRAHLSLIRELLLEKGFNVHVQEAPLNVIAREAIEARMNTDGSFDYLVFASRD